MDLLLFTARTHLCLPYRVEDGWLRRQVTNKEVAVAGSVQENGGMNTYGNEDEKPSKIQN